MSCCISNKREWSVEHNAITYSVLTHTLDPWVGSKVKNIFFLNVVMLHIKLKKKTLTLHTPLTLGQTERSDIEIVQISIFFIELGTKIIAFI